MHARHRIRKLKVKDTPTNNIKNLATDLENGAKEINLERENIKALHLTEKARNNWSAQF